MAMHDLVAARHLSRFSRIGQVVTAQRNAADARAAPLPCARLDNTCRPYPTVNRRRKISVTRHTTAQPLTQHDPQPKRRSETE